MLIFVSLATTAQARWEKMMNYDGTDFYVDLSSVKSGWTTSSYMLLENYLTGYSAGQSSIHLIQVKCKSLKHKMVEATYYSGLFGRGSFTDKLHEEWVQPVRGSVADALDRAVCGYIKSKK